MVTRVPNADRLVNRTPHIAPTDKSGLNADNIMLIFDNMLSGAYGSIGLYKDTYANLLIICQADPTGYEGTMFYCSDFKQFVGWNGSDLVILG